MRIQNRCRLSLLLFTLPVLTYSAPITLEEREYTQILARLDSLGNQLVESTAKLTTMNVRSESILENYDERIEANINRIERNNTLLNDLDKRLLRVENYMQHNTSFWTDWRGMLFGLIGSVLSAGIVVYLFKRHQA